jgi:hypothetical protein
MKTQILGALALALASQACMNAETLGTDSSELGIPPTGGTSDHFYWEAYEKQPYIYKGCPDPGPEPWAERATLQARRGTGVLERAGTAVALDIRAVLAAGWRGPTRGDRSPSVIRSSVIRRILDARHAWTMRLRSAPDR